MMRVGIDPRDFDDLEIQQKLGVLDEVKHELDGSEDQDSDLNDREGEIEDEEEDHDVLLQEYE